MKVRNKLYKHIRGVSDVDNSRSQSLEKHCLRPPSSQFMISKQLQTYKWRRYPNLSLTRVCFYYEKDKTQQQKRK